MQLITLYEELTSSFRESDVNSIPILLSSTHLPQHFLGELLGFDDRVALLSFRILCLQICFAFVYWFFAPASPFHF